MYATKMLGIFTTCVHSLFFVSVFETAFMVRFVDVCTSSR